MIDAHPPLPPLTRKGLNGAEKTLGVVLACVLFFAFELAAGSSYAFSGMMGLYAAAVAFAVWSYGGLSNMLGAVVFWYACQHVLLSQFFKVPVGEVPESRLFVPIPTVATEILVMLGFAVAGLLGRSFRPNQGRPLFPPITDIARLRQLTIVGTPMAIFVILFSSLAGGESGPVKMLTYIGALATAAAVATAVIGSGGKRMTNPFVWGVVGPILFFSLVGGARQGFLFSVASIVLAASAFGYRFRFHQYALGVLLGLFFYFILSPYSLAVRGVARTPSLATSINIAMDTFGDVVKDPMKYQFSDKEVLKNYAQINYQADYYKVPLGSASSILNRMGLIKLNDLIVRDTLQTGTTGWANITPSFSRLLPGFLAPDKDLIHGTSNALAHRVPGMVMANDFTTGITLGLTPDAFSAFKWYGVFFFPLGLMLIMVYAYKLVFALDMRMNVYSVGLVVPLSHGISEAPVGGFFAYPTYNLALYAIAAFLVVQAAKLIDFRYLRPKAIPKF